MDEISIDLTQITFDEAESRYAAKVAGISWDENVDAAYHDCSAESDAAEGMLVFDEMMFAGTGSAPSAYQLIIAMNPDRRESLYDYVGNSESIYRSLAPKTVFAIILLAAGAVLAASFLVLSILQAGRFVLPSPEGDPGKEDASGPECTRSRNYSISAPRASRIPVELLLLSDLIGILIYVHFAGEMSDLYGTFDSVGARLAFIICVEAGAALLLFLLLPLTAKGKARSMRTNSLVVRFKDRVIRGARAFYLHRRATGKLAICAAGFMILSLFLFWLRIRAGAWSYLLLLVVFWAAVFLLLFV